MFALLPLRHPFSSLSHGAACLASLAVVVLFYRRSRGARRAALLCFGLSLVLLFGASATYHALNVPLSAQRTLQLIDQSAIYILIAGTYTPTLYVLLAKGWVKTTLLSTIWAMALSGIICKWALTELPYWLVVAPYIALGWIGTLIYNRLHRVVGVHGMKWVLTGGIAYSVGAIIDWQQWPDFYGPAFGPHELFHVFVMAGALCHIVFMIHYALPYQAAVADMADPDLALSLQPPRASADA